MGKDITIDSKDGSFGGYLATPASGKGPGIVVVQEIFGINRWVRSVVDQYAAEGYTALALDLFWRIAPGIQLDPTKEDELKQGFGLYQKYNPEAGVADIQATIDALRKMPECTGKVGVTGYCLGGLLTYLAAARTDLDAASSYYGGGINTKLDEAAKIKKPTLLHLAGDDEHMGPDAQEKIKAGTANNPNITVHIYPGAQHAFCRAIDAKHFHAESCKLANSRTLALFKQALA